MLFDKEHDDGLEKTFIAQFEENNGRIIYRRDGRFGPVQVSRDERNALIRQFRIRRKWLDRATTGVGIATMAILYWFFWAKHAEAMEPLALLFWLCLGAPLWLAHRWMWRAPQRLTARRLPLGQDKPAREFAIERYRALRWWELAGPPLAAMMMAMHQFWKGPLVSVDHIIFAVATIAVLTAASVQIGRKLWAEWAWRVDTQRSAAHLVSRI